MDSISAYLPYIGCLGGLFFIVLVIVAIIILTKKKKPAETKIKSESKPSTEEQEEESEEEESKLSAEPAAEVEEKAETPVEQEKEEIPGQPSQDQDIEIWGTLVIDDSSESNIVGTEYKIAGSIIIGRSPDADISCTFDKAMSRQHSEIYMGTEGNVMIRDMGSSNGTIINNQPIAEATALEDGMVILLGETTFVWKTS